MDKIKHLIVLMMENRSFDHYLGALTLEDRSDIDGLSSPLPTLKDNAGADVTSWPMDGMPHDYPDPPHGWDAAHADFNGGRNDGFVIQYQLANPRADAKIPMGYYTRKTLPVLYALADEFTVCDHWFCSVLSSTWPNRKYLHSGHRDDDPDTATMDIAGQDKRPEPACPGSSGIDTMRPTVYRGFDCLGDNVCENQRPDGVASHHRGTGPGQGALEEGRPRAGRSSGAHERASGELKPAAVKWSKGRKRKEG